MKSLNFFNTLANKLESFAPIKPPVVLLYTCGPTVYNFAHIGNFRTYVFEDILKRVLLYFGYSVKHVMNITDIDDKTLKGAIEKKIPLKEYTEPFTEAFFEDLKALHILKADHYPRATDYIDSMVEMIDDLIQKGHAYKGPDGSIYFSIASFPTYGKLSHLDKKSLEVGASKRVAADEYDKDNPQDFVLWKAYDESRDGNIYWSSKLGKGRPGWHIECSAMATDLLGPHIDIHCGGIDNIFPHHENEIAQCEACSKGAFSRFWMHSQHLLVEGRKMSKSVGNFFTLRDLLAKGYSARAIRFVLVSSHYRMPLNFTFEGLEAAKSSLNRIDSLLARLQSANAPHACLPLDLSNKVHDFEEALKDDLNMPLGFSHLFEMIRMINTYIDENPINHKEATRLIEILQKMDKVLGFIFHESHHVPSHITELANLRVQAKKNKNFQESDRLREEIKDHGFLIEDTPSGYRVIPL